MLLHLWISFGQGAWSEHGLVIFSICWPSMGCFDLSHDHLLISAQYLRRLNCWSKAVPILYICQSETQIIIVGCWSIGCSTFTKFRVDRCIHSQHILNVSEIGNSGQWTDATIASCLCSCVKMNFLHPYMHPPKTWRGQSPSTCPSSSAAQVNTLSQFDASFTPGTSALPYRLWFPCWTV